MEIHGLKLIDLAILYKKTLIICDVHIGYEEALNKQGLLLPRIHFKEQVKRMKDIMEKADFDRIVINGDLKHEFGTISRTEWRNTLKFLDLFGDKEIILVKGNHDNIMGPIAKKRNLRLADHYIMDDVLICHGDRIIKDKAGTIIIGHEHPAASIRDSIRNERYKCYLIGKYRRKNLIVQPSFNLVTTGTDVLNEKLLSPYLDDIDDFRVIVVEDKLYDFGRVKDL